MKIRYGWLLIFIVLFLNIEIVNASVYYIDFTASGNANFQSLTAGSEYWNGSNFAVYRVEQGVKVQTINSTSGINLSYDAGVGAIVGINVDGLLTNVSETISNIEFKVASTSGAIAINDCTDTTFTAGWNVMECLTPNTINHFIHGFDYGTVTGMFRLYGDDTLYSGFEAIRITTTQYDDDAIQFDEETYSYGDTITVTANLTDPDWDLYEYTMYVFYPDGSTRTAISIPNGVYSYDWVGTADKIGEWSSRLSQFDAQSVGYATNLDTDSAVVNGDQNDENYIHFDADTYGLNYIATIEYGIATLNWTDSDWGTSFRVYLKDQDGTVMMHFDATEQNGSFNYMFAESGVYTVELRDSWLHLTEHILAIDSATVQESLVDANGYGSNINPSIATCGQSIAMVIYSNAESYTTYVNFTNSAGTTIHSKLLTWDTETYIHSFGNTSGYITLNIMNGSTNEYQKEFRILTCYGSGNNGEGIQPGSGFGDGQTYTSDTASSNAQQNFINFIAYPIFWGLLILIAIVMVLALNHYGNAIPYVVPVVVFFELVIGLLEPYTAFIGVSMVVFIVGLILIKQRS